MEELVKIKEQSVLVGNNNEKLVQDLIKQLKVYKLNKKLKELKSKQRALEAKGKIEESIQIAIEINKVNEQLKKGVK